VNNQLQIGFGSEWAPLQSAVVHDGVHNARTLSIQDWCEEINLDELARHQETGPVEREIIIEQIKRFHQILEARGVKLVHPTPIDRADDQVFTRDPCFVVGNGNKSVLFVASMRDEYRLPEVKGIASVRDRIAKTIDPPGEGSVVEGGDVFQMNPELVLVGIGDTTNEAGYQHVKEVLSQNGIEVIAVPHKALHLDCCLAPLPDGSALYSKSRLPETSKDIIQCKANIREWHKLDPHEDKKYLASNMLWLDEKTVVSTTHVPKTNDFLRDKGFKVIEVEFDQMIHMWGSVRCCVCPLLRG